MGVCLKENVSSEFPQREKKPAADTHLPRSIPSGFIRARITRACPYKMQTYSTGTRFTLPPNRKPQTRSVTPYSSYLLLVVAMRDGSRIKLVIHVIVIAYIPDGAVIATNVRAPSMRAYAYFIISEQRNMHIYISRSLSYTYILWIWHVICTRVLNFILNSAPRNCTLGSNTLIRSKEVFTLLIPGKFLISLGAWDVIDCRNNLNVI